MQHGSQGATVSSLQQDHQEGYVLLRGELSMSEAETKVSTGIATGRALPHGCTCVGHRMPGRAPHLLKFCWPESDASHVQGLIVFSRLFFGLGVAALVIDIGIKSCQVRAPCVHAAPRETCCSHHASVQPRLRD